MTKRKGIIFIISAPSGAGKTTLCHKLLETCSGLNISVSYTTRKPRDGEIDGVHYFFVNEDVFKDMILADEFLEWAKVHGNLYGTSKIKINEILMQGVDAVLDIDVQGGKLIRGKIPDSVMIFILPPSMKILEDRLKGRKSDSEETILERIKRAKDEIAEYKHYDYVIVNNTLEEAIVQLKAAIFAERSRVSRTDHNWIEKNFL